jgi:hypothetical protein
VSRVVHHHWTRAVQKGWKATLSQGRRGRLTAKPSAAGLRYPGTFLLRE